MKFRLSDEKAWTREFSASSPAELARGIARAWDERIEAVRRSPGATHPAFALPVRLAEIDRWLTARLAREGITAQQRQAWEQQADHWRYTARRDLGGDVSTSPLRLHVWAPGEPHGKLSLWSTLCVRGSKEGGWQCSTSAPQVARGGTAERAAELWAGAEAIVEHTRNLIGLCDHVGKVVHAELFPKPVLVR